MFRLLVSLNENYYPIVCERQLEGGELTESKTERFLHGLLTKKTETFNKGYTR